MFGMKELTVAALLIIIAILAIAGCTQTPITPTLIPKIGDNFLIHGYVNIDGKTVTGADVEAISADNVYHFENVTNDNGAYVLYLPKNLSFNVSATYQGLQHTVWPVSVGDSDYLYNISITTTPKSFIEGTGYSVGGYLGYNNSQPLTGFTFNAIQANDNTTFTAVIKDDWSYSLEVKPGVKYHLDRRMPDVHFYSRNGDYMSDVVVGPNETALIDYVVVLP
jgi:hypothetical protein